MKSRFLTLVPAIALFATLAIPIRLAAQDKPTQNDKHHHYKLIDLGTSGGPQSWVFGALEFPSATLSNTGVVGAANTHDSNPNYPNCNPFVPLLCALYFTPDPFVEHAFEWRDGNFTDLGVLPGGSNSYAQWISGNGLIVGTSENGLIDPLTGYPEGRGVLWKNGKAIDLGTYGGNESAAGAVNNRGQVAGFATNTIPDAFSGFGTQQRPFLWQKGVKRDLGNLGTGTDAIAYLVNEHGQVAGAAFTNTIIDPHNGIPNQDPFFWQDDGRGMQDIGTFGGGIGFANQINNRGQVVGQSDPAPGGQGISHGFLWEKGVLTDLGVLPGGLSSTAHWINDAGDTVGLSGVQNDQFAHAVLWKRRSHLITDLGTVGADTCSSAESINSSGQIVGESFDCAGTVQHAFLWEMGGPMVDLNTLVAPGSGLTLVFAASINDDGEIAGDGLLSNGDNHAFLLTPCDEHHPGVEGCDYSLIDASELPQVPVSPGVSTQTSGQPFQFPRARFPFRNRVLGRPLMKSGIDGESAQRSSRNSEDLLTDTLDGAALRCIRGCTGVGYCTIDSNNKLTGGCLGSSIGGSCASKSQPVQCPVGKQAISPTNFTCFMSVARVDAARSCID